MMSDEELKRRIERYEKDGLLRLGILLILVGMGIVMLVAIATASPPPLILAAIPGAGMLLLIVHYCIEITTEGRR